MKHHTTVPLVLVVVAVVVSGCTHFQQTLIKDEITYRKTNPQNIRIYLSNQLPDKPYEEIGCIVADKEDPEAAVKFIKERAAEMGADAIMNCEVRVYTQVVVIIFIPVPAHSYIASGIAVKYTNM